jgi:hypothetical protein
MTYREPKRQTDGSPAASQEDLLRLLRKAERCAYVLAHSYDIDGQPDRAYGFVALGERLRETVSDASDLASPVEPYSEVPVIGLRSRALLLRRLLKGIAWQGPSRPPPVPQVFGEQRLAEGTDAMATATREHPR